jgi:hypothetical protein
MKLSYTTYLNAHAMSMHITFSHKKAAMKVNWIMKAARRTKLIQSYKLYQSSSVNFKLINILIDLYNRNLLNTPHNEIRE